MAAVDARGRRRVAIAAIAIVALSAAAFVLVCDDGPSEQLRALQDDPMGEFVPHGGRLVRTIARDARSTGTFNKATPAKVTRLFALQPATAETALRDAIETARAAGWPLESARRGLAATGEKRLPTGHGILTISLSPDGAPGSVEVDGPVLSIGLEHGSE